MPSFLLPCTIPDLHDLSTHSSPLNQWLRLISPFRLREFQLSNFTFLHMEIFWSRIFVATCLLESMARMSSASPTFGNFNSQTLASSDWLFSRVEDLLTHVLPNQWLCSHFGNLASSTISTVLSLHPRSMIEIFSGSSEFYPSSFPLEF
jgi:hypothetical protein